jgi:hypothetical protein
MLRGDPTGHDCLVGGKRNAPQSPLAGNTPLEGGLGDVQTEKVTPAKWLELPSGFFI